MTWLMNGWIYDVAQVSRHRKDLVVRGDRIEAIDVRMSRGN